MECFIALCRRPAPSTWLHSTDVEDTFVGDDVGVDHEIVLYFLHRVVGFPSCGVALGQCCIRCQGTITGRCRLKWVESESEHGQVAFAHADHMRPSCELLASWFEHEHTRGYTAEAQTEVLPGFASESPCDDVVRIQRPSRIIFEGMG